MNKLIIIGVLIAVACTNSTMDGVYVVNKKKLRDAIVNKKGYVVNGKTEWILNEIDKSELTLVIKADSVQIISSGQALEKQSLWYKSTSIQSGIKFTMKNGRGALVKSDSGYMLSVQERIAIDASPNMDYSPTQTLELIKVEGEEADKYVTNGQKSDGDHKLSGAELIPKSNFELLQGKWQSTEDETVFLIFESDTRTEVSSGGSDNAKFILSDQCANPADKSTEKPKPDDKDRYISLVKDNMCWYVVSLNETNLELAYMGRGNSLSYKRVE